MTKAELASKIAADTYIEKVTVEAVLASFFDVVKTTLAQNETIYVRGFGNFQNKQRNQKVARNIHTGATIIVEPHLFPTFKPSKTFVAMVKENTKEEVY